MSVERFFYGKEADRGAGGSVGEYRVVALSEGLVDKDRRTLVRLAAEGLHGVEWQGAATDHVVVMQRLEWNGRRVPIVCLFRPSKHPELARHGGVRSEHFLEGQVLIGDASYQEGIDSRYLASLLHVDPALDLWDAVSSGCFPQHALVPRPRLETYSPKDCFLDQQDILYVRRALTEDSQGGWPLIGVPSRFPQVARLCVATAALLSLPRPYVSMFALCTEATLDSRNDGLRFRSTERSESSVSSGQAPTIFVREVVKILTTSGTQALPQWAESLQVIGNFQGSDTWADLEQAAATLALANDPADFLRDPGVKLSKILNLGADLDDTERGSLFRKALHYFIDTAAWEEIQDLLNRHSAILTRGALSGEFFELFASATVLAPVDSVLAVLANGGMAKWNSPADLELKFALIAAIAPRLDKEQARQLQPFFVSLLERAPAQPCQPILFEFLLGLRASLPAILELLDCMIRASPTPELLKNWLEGLVEVFSKRDDAEVALDVTSCVLAGSPITQTEMLSSDDKLATAVATLSVPLLIESDAQGIVTSKILLSFARRHQNDVAGLIEKSLSSESLRRTVDSSEVREFLKLGGSPTLPLLTLFLFEIFSRLGIEMPDHYTDQETSPHSATKWCKAAEDYLDCAKGSISCLLDFCRIAGYPLWFRNIYKRSLSEAFAQGAAPQIRAELLHYLRKDSTIAPTNEMAGFALSALRGGDFASHSLRAAARALLDQRDDFASIVQCKVVLGSLERFNEPVSKAGESLDRKLLSSHFKDLERLARAVESLYFDLSPIAGEDARGWDSVALKQWISRLLKMTGKSLSETHVLFHELVAPDRSRWWSRLIRRSQPYIQLPGGLQGLLIEVMRAELRIQVRR